MLLAGMKLDWIFRDNRAANEMESTYTKKRLFSCSEHRLVQCQADENITVPFQWEFTCVSSILCNAVSVVSFSVLAHLLVRALALTHSWEGSVCNLKPHC